MSDLQPGQASVFFEVKFDKLAPASLRTTIATECTTKLNQIVPEAKRTTWLNQPYTQGNDPADLLAHVETLFTQANPTLSVTPTPKQDFYCWFGPNRNCYTPFEVLENGQPVIVVVESDGYAVSCQLIAVMATVPT